MALALGSAISGLLAYVFFALVTRTIGSAVAAPVSVLWTYWSAAGAVLTFPLQHWLTRTVAADGGEDGVRHAIPRLLVVIAGLAATIGLLAWIGRDSLFHDRGAAFPVFAALLTLGSSLSGVVRGALASRQRLVSLGLGLVGENAVRCIAAGVLSVADVHSASAYGLVLVGGQLVWLCWPSGLRFVDGGAGARGAGRSPLAFLSGVAGGSLIGQIVLTGGPVVLALEHGSPAAVTALFAGLALFRAPYTLSLGVVAPVTTRLTTLVISGRQDTLRRVRLGIVAVTSLGTLSALALGAAAGPWLVRAVFGGDVRLDHLAAALIATGSTVAMANLVMTLSLVARGRSGAVLRCWVLGAITAAVALVVTGATSVRSLTGVVVAFVAAELVTFVVMVVEEPRGPTSAAVRDPSDEVVVPG